MNCPKLKSFKDLRLFIYSDKKAQGGGNSIKKFFFSPVFRFTVLLRCNEFLVNNNFPLILQVFWRLWYKRLGVKLSFSIPMNVFDSGLGIVHYGLLVVSPDARIGANCRVHAGVNIGGSAGFKQWVIRNVMHLLLEKLLYRAWRKIIWSYFYWRQYGYWS